MRVAACSADGNFQIEHRLRPEPGPEEMVLKTVWCGFCGTDLFKMNNRTEPEGTILGHELVGTVERVGASVTTFEPGQRVVVPHHVACGRCPLCQRGSRTLCPVFKENLMAPGGFSEFVLLRSRAVAQAARVIPDGMTDEGAAFLEPAACVLRGIDKADIRDPKGCAVVIGGGSMGLLHLLVLTAINPDLSVIVSDPIADRLTLATRLGASHGCRPEALALAVNQVTDGIGADAVFDTVGGAAVLTDSLDLIRGGGTVVLFAHAADGEAADFPLNPLFKNEKRVVATYSGSLEEQDRIAELLFSGRLDPRPLVTHRIALDRAQEALDLARQRTALKVLIGPPTGENPP